ncbi:Protein root UVB sensitive/RUS domain-containing protein [Entamoeba marina]
MIARGPSPHGKFEITESKGAWSRRYIFDDDFPQIQRPKTTNYLQELIVPVGYPTSVGKGFFRYVSFTAAMEACNMLLLVMSVSAFLRLNSGISAAFFIIFREAMTGLMHLFLTQRWGASIVFNAKQWRMRIEIISELLLLVEVAFISTSLFSWVDIFRGIVEGALNATRQVIKTRILNNYAKSNNVAELTEKVQNLESLTRVISLIIGYAFLNLLGDFTEHGVVVVVCAFLVHCVCNFLCSNVIIFKTINFERLTLLMNFFVSVKNEILPPPAISKMESKLRVKDMTRIRMGISLNSIPKTSDLYWEVVESIQTYQYYLYKTTDNEIWVILSDKINKDGVFEALLCAYSQVLMGWDPNRSEQVKEWNIVELLKEKGWNLDNLDVRIGSYRIDTSLLKQ